MSPLKHLLEEIHRRSLWQVLSVYVAGAWVALQVVATFAAQLLLPAWVFRGALILLAVGLPMVLATAALQGGIRPRRTVSATGIRRVLRWRNALLAGGAAFMLLGLGTAGYLVSRAMGIGPAASLIARGALEADPTFVLADFESEAPALGRAITEALRVDLSQSGVVRLADASEVLRSLQRMERPADAPLDPAAAREIALREGFAGVVGGEIHPVSAAYALAVRLETTGGDLLASERETARDSSEILPAIDRLSQRLRARIGESVGSIRADPPLSRVTTANLEALKKFSQALDVVRRGNGGFLPYVLLEEAVALDSTFAMAQAHLAGLLLNAGVQRDRAVQALRGAYDHRERLTERERHLLVGAYHAHVTGDLDQEIVAYEALLTIEPNQNQALGQLGGLYLRLRDYERAEHFSRRALAEGPESDLIYRSQVAQAQARMGRFDAALGTWLAFDSVAPRRPGPAEFLGHLHASQRSWGTADGLFRRLEREWRDDAFWRVNAQVDLAALRAARGRVHEAVAYLDEVNATNRQQGMRGHYLKTAIWQSMIETLVAGDTVAAQHRLAAALREFPLSDLPLLDRPYLQLADLYAIMGEPARARAALEAFEAEVPRDMRAEEFSYWRLYIGNPDRSRAHLALAEGWYEDAVAAARRSDFGLCRICYLPILAVAYERAGEPDSAVAMYERFLSIPSPVRLWEGDPFFLGQSLERLAGLYHERGDLQNAAKYYAQFLELWEDADPELHPRVQAAQRRLEEIVAERG